MRHIILLATLLPLAACASGAPSAENCPAVRVDAERGRLAKYPGMASGRVKTDYEFIAAASSVTALCASNKDGMVFADVTLNYALRPGPLYQGAVSLEAFAAAQKNGGVAGQPVTEQQTLTPASDSAGVTASVTIRGLLLGTEDEVEAGAVTISAGFVQP
jgi:hypothetical protein